MNKYEELIQSFSKKLPHFADGRIDYSNAKEAPVINCFVEFEGKILLLKRSDKVGNYQGKWNSIGGYLDEPVPIEDKVKKELEEELNVPADNIKTIKVGESYTFCDNSIGKTWYIFPVLSSLKHKPKIELDWEHTDFVWIEREDIKSYDTVPRLEEVLNHINQI